MTESAAPWDELRAEMFDTIRSSPYARPKRDCVYCGAPTKALSQVCTAHSDLPRVDPVFNVQAGRYGRAGSRAGSTASGPHLEQSPPCPASSAAAPVNHGGLGQLRRALGHPGPAALATTKED